MKTKLISKRTKKQIDADVLTGWQAKMYFTTQAEIAEGTHLSIPTISDAFHEKKATQSTIDKLTKYFNEMEIPA